MPLSPRIVLLIGALFVISDCAMVHKIGPLRSPMVRDPETGIQYGSTVDNTIFTDPEMIANKRIKVTVRNTSGDPLFNMEGFKSSIEQSFYRKGYEPSDGRDFGLKVDVNVTFSGQIQKDRTMQSMIQGGLLGAAAGVAYWQKEDDGWNATAARQTAYGLVSGVSIGYLVGRYLTEETYIVEATIGIGLRQSKTTAARVVTFSRSPKLTDHDLEPSGFGKWRDTVRVRAAVYAGGTAVPQSKIAHEVRRRLASVVADII